MNIYFGKISTKFEKAQITEGYYKAPKNSSWFGNIEIGDYTYIIGGDKIQFWKAREWGEHEGSECLWFDIINSDLGIRTNRFTALNFLKLTTDVIIHTSRSAKNRSFFKLELIDKINISNLSDVNFYKNDNLYRKTIIHKNESLINQTSKDLQFFYNEDILKFYPNDFTETRIIVNFKDNLPFLGKGSSFKDNTISKIVEKKSSLSYQFPYYEISIRSLYDTFFCEYKIKEKHFLVGTHWKDFTPQDQIYRFIKNSIWENGPDEKYSNLILNVPVNSKIAIRSVDKKGNRMHIKAIGEVIKNYGDGKKLDIEWEEEFNEFTVNFTSGYWKRINEIKNKEHINTIWNNSKTHKSYEENMKENNYIPPALNQIFYGPPGTGKTYSTLLEAGKIVTQNEDITYNDSKELFNQQLGNQIEFITFHQNYSYEDFIQGLRPDENNGELSFYKKDGVFKRIANKALNNLNASEKVTSIKKDFETVFSNFLKPLNEEEVYEIEVKMKKTSYYITEVGEKSIEFRKNQGDSKHTLSIATLKRMYEKGINNIILGGLQPYYNPILSELLKESKKEIQPVEKKNFVIIIDEINRANISRVFGELITLIEKDKRSHGAIPLTTTLPSGEPFKVPSNLYIIGTMNTADKSIALLDIALRRRFEFIPMYPTTEILNNGKNMINDPIILEKINTEIIDRKGHDFTIGHSYFMGDDYTLEHTINTKVIPLLLEYFMNDVEEVKLILKNADLVVDGWPMKLTIND